MTKILFHGGSEIITQPEIREPVRTLDFGKGFYLTTSKAQAERWVRSRLSATITKGFVNSYTFNSQEAEKCLNIKYFNSASEEWIDFVLANRMIENFEHDYDIVIGPVADDRVYTQFSLFEGGIISKETLIKELKTYRLVDQYLFHTEEALPYLIHTSFYEITK